MGRLEYVNSAGRFDHLDGTRVVWRSDAPPAFLLPDSYALNWSGDLDYPDFVKGNGMFYSRVASGNVLFPDSYYGAVFDIVRAGDWGPDEAGTYLLDRILLGTVPAGCNHLDTAISLTQTKVPEQFWFFDVITYQKAGEQIVPDSGFLPLEAAAPWRRTMSIVLAVDDNGDGDANGVGLTRNVYLERRQSVAAITSFTSVTGGSLKSGAQNYDGSPTGAWEGKFTHDGNPAGWPAKWTGVKGPGGDLHMMRGGSNAPVATDPSDFSSTWAADITIRPGFVHS